VYPYLKSRKWETRISAARALGGIVNHAVEWNPNADDLKEEINEEEAVKIEDFEMKLDEDEQEFISLDNWNLAELLKSGKKLLSCSENEVFKVDTKKAKLVKDEEELIPSDKPEVKSEVKSEVKLELESEVLSPMDEDKSSSNVSSTRLKAMAKRRAKRTAKNGPSKARPIDISQSSVSRKLVQNPDLDIDSTSASPKTPDIDITDQSGGNKIVVESKLPEIPEILSAHSKVSGLVWQFQGVYELLILDLFADKWEVRHGAVLGLRELMKKQGSGAGRVKGKSLEENNSKNKKTLEDLASRLLSLFALDRFGDYVYDTVVAPVRESAAQTLAALLKHLDVDSVVKVFHCLDDLVLQQGITLDANSLPCWEASHGGMLGLRYFVSVRTDILASKPELLDDVLKMVLHGLKESDDDVQAVAAATLTPITDEFVQLKKNTIGTIIITIWECLTKLKDDLSASIGSVMDLLSKLCIHPEVLDIIKQQALDNEEYSFKKLIPKLFPFLRHSITNVRKSVLNTLLAFLSIPDKFCKDWIDGVAYRLIFQNLLLEQTTQVLELSELVFEKLLIETFENQEHFGKIDDILATHFEPMINLLMTPIGVSRFNYHMNSNYILKPSGAQHIVKSETLSPSPALKIEEFEDFDTNPSSNSITNSTTTGSKRGRKRKTPPQKEDSLIPPSSVDDHRVNIDGPMIIGDITLLGVDVFYKTRIASSIALGKIFSYLNEDSLLRLFQLLRQYLSSSHATSRLLTSIIIKEYCSALIKRGLSPSKDAVDSFYDILINTLNDTSSLPYFKELVPTLKAVRTQCHSLFRIFTEQGNLSNSKIPDLAVVVQGEDDAGPGAFSLETAEVVVNETYDKLFKLLTPVNKMTSLKALEDAKSRASKILKDAQDLRLQRTNAILANYAAASIVLAELPKKLNAFIRSLMGSIKSEELEDLQKRSAHAISDLIQKLIASNKNNVSDKIVKNLCGFLCVDTSEVPEFISNKELKLEILSLKKEEENIMDQQAYEATLREAKIKRRGAKLALENLLAIFQKDIFIRIVQLHKVIFNPLFEIDDNLDEVDDTKGQEIIDSFGILKALSYKFDPTLYDEILKVLPSISKSLTSSYSVFRYSASRTLSSLAKISPSKVIPFIIRSVLPLLNNAGDVKDRQGGIEAIYHLSNTMEADILPYVIFLIVPVLGRMSDFDKDVRILATTTFASIIKLVPLEAGIPDPVDIPQDLLEGKEKEREFIQQMMDPAKSNPFELPVAIKATLRKYQQEGVNWLAFLNKYHLHGILCDDMGLGKTLQTICIVASDHHLRAEDYSQTKSIESRPLPSLIVCPPSLLGHWEVEINNFAPFLKVGIYSGGPSIRQTLREQQRDVNIIVTSYDVVRNDIEYLSSKDYNYCVLDEGHIIKNSNSKLTKSVKRIRSNHRLILSGTPIQNNVLELWSLFDFLMPGFLGSEKSFHEKFAKPIAASRNSKTSSKEQEAGALALEALHKQVLPFMLRRLKEEVLSDLPPKIIQDYYCQLGDLQKQLYNDFAKKQKDIVTKEIQNPGELESSEGKNHIFKILNYMKKLTNHPKLVLNAEHPQYNEVQKYLKQTGQTLNDIKHSPKLLALKTLLLECGIGVQDVEKKRTNDALSGDVISQHRVLIFCQLKDMLDMVEEDLFKKHLPSVTFMRLDGSTDPRDRQKIVQKFNQDPSIDVLLLTTKVGGLGLNLTGADTVIFVEHDWNPMNDLQAMDRAHRIGQKKVVNVYRLITKDTLEEKIMGLQKFKMNIASTIVSQQNTGLASMDTNQLLDLFDVEQQGQQETNEELNENTESNGKKQDLINETGLTGKAGEAVGELGELWDEAQYEEEYNLDNFIKNLK
jgi:TATA-binding protein-associated factor